jgi:hypothetical protein
MRERLRSRRLRPSRRASANWSAPTVDSFGYGRILAFDQTLTKTGWSFVENTPEEGLRVIEANLLMPQVAMEGFEATYEKARLIGGAVEMIVSIHGGDVDEVVHEMPAVQGRRIESSLMAGREVRRAVSVHCPTTPLRMVSKQQAASLLLPPDRRQAKDSKAAVKAVVNTLIPPEMRHAQRWNQDVTDSVALALTRLYFRKEQAA